jgi:hypothetical protein
MSIHKIPEITVWSCPNCNNDIYEFNQINNHPELYYCSECNNAYTKKDFIPINYNIPLCKSFSNIEGTNAGCDNCFNVYPLRYTSCVKTFKNKEGK